MAKTIELFYSIQNGRPSIRFHVTEVVEGNARAKFQELMNDLPGPITDSLKDLPPARLLSSDEVEVKSPTLSESNNSATSSADIRSCSEPTLQSPCEMLTSPTPKPKKRSKREPITESQANTIIRSLMERNIPASVFCQHHGVNQIMDLTKGAAWHIIHENDFC